MNEPANRMKEGTDSGGLARPCISQLGIYSSSCGLRVARVCTVRARHLAHPYALILRARHGRLKQREEEWERQIGRERKSDRGREKDSERGTRARIRSVSVDASVSPPRVTGEYSFIKLRARRVRARRPAGLCRTTPLSRRAIVALVGSQVFFVSLSHVPSSSVIDLARSSRLARTFQLFSLSLSLSLSQSLPLFFLLSSSLG